MGWKHHNSRPNYPIPLTNPTLLTLAAFLFTSLFLLIRFLEPSHSPLQQPFSGDLLDADFPWNKLCFGASSDKLKLAVFSKSWPIGASPGGMERHAATLYTALAEKGHEIHVFTVPSDRRPHPEIHGTNLHVYFAANEHGSVNNSWAYEIFKNIDDESPFDYVHSESVSLPHWRAKTVPKLAVTWHGIWYEIMHSKLFEELFSNPNGELPGAALTELQEAMPRLVDEIRFFRSYKQHICISNSAGDVLVKVYQQDRRNVHVILNGVDDSQFVHDPYAGEAFRKRYGIPGLSMNFGGPALNLLEHPHQW
ncbi:hypothetical protein LINPERHAP2_LOCUS24688 [Linum perenne]